MSFCSVSLLQKNKNSEAEVILLGSYKKKCIVLLHQVLSADLKKQNKLSISLLSSLRLRQIFMVSNLHYKRFSAFTATCLMEIMIFVETQTQWAMDGKYRVTRTMHEHAKVDHLSKNATQEPSFGRPLQLMYVCFD